MILLVLTERQAVNLARCTDDETVHRSLEDQLRFARLFARVDDTPTTIVLKRRPDDGRLVYTAATFGSEGAADLAFDRLWARTLAQEHL